jgi:RNA polymerase sigma factor (sigma-70 family)
MPQSGMSAATGQLDSLLRAGSMAGLSDAELLDRVIATDREVASVAFEALIRRHGAMVLATCRGVLRNEHDAEDMFQIAFLTLARRAGSLRCASSLGAWLHRVALRASERARAQAAQRRIHETARAELLAMSRHQPSCDAERDELHQFVHHEVDRLPERYRIVLVLCDLQSATYEQAAAKLRVPVGTVRSRLSRAREQLRKGIERRGFALPASLLPVTLAGRDASASVPPRLIAGTLRSVNLSFAGAGALTASTQAVALLRWLVSSFGMASLGKALLALGLVALGVGFVAGNSVVHRAKSAVQSGAERPVRQNQPAATSSEERRNQGTVSNPPEKKPAQAIPRASLVSLLDEARRSAADLKDARSKARMLLAVAMGYAKLKDAATASAVFQQAIQAAMAIDDQQKAYTIEEIAAAQIDGQGREAALATMRRALELTERIPYLREHNSTRMYIVRTLARAGALDEALRIVRDLPPTGMYRSRALAYTLGGLKQSDAKAARLFMPTFLTMAEEIGDRTRWAECMGFIADVLTDADDVGDLIRIADKLEASVAEFGLADTRGQNCLHSEVLVLTALAKAQAKAGSRAAAVATFNKAEALGGMPPSEGESLRSGRLSRLAGARAGAGDVEGAIRTAGLIVYEYHKAIALMQIAENQANAGHREDARTLFSRAIQTAREIKIRDPLRDRPGSSIFDVSECLRTIAYVQARAGFIDDALLTADSISEPNRRNSALAGIAPCMVQQGQIKPALELAQRITDEKAKNAALEGVARAQSASGDLSGALEWVRSRTTPEARANALLGVVLAIGKR